ncbi:unnamed protein product [Moritella viscosa]|nr:unnamed protein product [Moritella viscosa]SGY85106.1 unnamed protein product [Moritella viscosa]SHN98404.1 unnamed protein product [Moritella viscosa]SHN98410.1 unnamed protein product [Moritella viscosa]SHN98438.1 unnamed protein product [Moritella viscosa]
MKRTVEKIENHIIEYYLSVATKQLRLKSHRLTLPILKIMG